MLKEYQGIFYNSYSIYDLTDTSGFHTLIKIPDLKKIFGVSDIIEARKKAEAFYLDYMNRCINDTIDNHNHVSITGTRNGPYTNCWSMFVDNNNLYETHYNVKNGGYNPCFCLNLQDVDYFVKKRIGKYFLMKLKLPYIRRIREKVRRNKLYFFILKNT